MCPYVSLLIFFFGNRPVELAKKSAKIIVVDVFAPKHCPTAAPDVKCFFCIFIVFIISPVLLTQDFLSKEKEQANQKSYFSFQKCLFYFSKFFFVDASINTSLFFS
jgi:hypothetical protein